MDNQAVQPQPQAPTTSAPLILIVEDDASLAKMYALKFSNEGFRVTVANDGARGLQLAAEERPNIILLDMMLPKYSGIEFLEQLQQHLKQINMPILALSNLTEKQEADRALKLGVKEYLAKAMNTPEDVVAKVKQYLGAPQSPAKTEKTQL
jgi:DNA-binding response OmpR family regulator